MTLLFLCTLDQLPLVEPLFEDEIAAIARNKDTATAVAPSSMHRLSLGAKMQGSLQSGTLRGGAFGVVELSARLPVLADRLGVMAEVGFGGQWGEVHAPQFASALLASWRQALGLLALRFAAGATVDWLSISITQDGTRRDDAYATLGATAGVALLIPLWRGDLLVEARYRLTTLVARGQSEYAQGATLGLGYAFHLL